MGGRRRSEPACLLVCAGKDCRSDRGYDALVELAGDLPHAYAMPCQGLCHGPIAGVRIDERTFWFERVRGKKVRQQIVRLLDSGKRPASLRRLEVRGHRDELRGAGRAKPLGRRSRRGALA